MNALLQLSWNSAGGFRLPDQWVWCGSAVRSDGKYCLFAACWPSTFPMLEGYLLSSRIVLAVSDTPEGPYRYRCDIAPEPGSGLRMAHNPTVLRRDGRYYLYFIGSTYPGEPDPGNPELLAEIYRNIRIYLMESTAPEGPWRMHEEPILQPQPDAWDAALGVKVTVIEYLPRMMPLEDEEVSKTMERAFRKLRATVLVGTAVRQVRVTDDGRCEVEIEGKKGPETLTADVVLSAVGIQANIEGIGLEELGVEVERGKVQVDEFYRTNIPGVYAIGDIVPGPALAHVASAEAICCVEAICGLDPAPVDYSTIPSCVFTQPEVASVGMTEQQAAERGIAVKIGRFPFTASGKATAAGDRDGFVKLIFDEQEHLLGAHMVGASVTEMLAEPTLARKLGATAHQIARTIHAHPTMNEGVMEAAEAALGAAIHL